MSKPDLRDPEEREKWLDELTMDRLGPVGFWGRTPYTSARLPRRHAAALRDVAPGMIPPEPHQERPALWFRNASDGRDVQMAFGYFYGVPTAAVFRESDTAPLMIPREVLQIALEQGWEE